MKTLPWLKLCIECGDPYWCNREAEGRPRITCTARCGRRRAKREYERTENGRAARARQAHVRRMRHSGAEVERFTFAEICVRDKWRCGVCGKKVPRVKYPDPQSPSLDHVIPLSQGGPHTRANVRLTHWLCNSRRGTRGTDQLRLLG